MKGVLFTGGKAPKFQTIKNDLLNAHLIVAADSGFDSALKMGIKPDIIIGDMDSVQELTSFNQYSSDKIMKYPRDKDETDTELGIKYLQDNNCNEIILIGGGGGRMDHFLALVLLFDREFSPDIWYTHNARFQKISGKCAISGLKGDLVSFFPTGKNVCRMTSNGLKWPLDNLEWTRGDMGISNIAISDPFYIDMIEGSLLMINQLKDHNIE